MQTIFTPIENAIDINDIYLTADEIKKYINGVKIEKKLKKGEYIIKDVNDTVIGIGYIDENNILKGKILLNEDY